MASPVHPAIGRSYGPDCDIWLLQPQFTPPSSEVIRQFHPGVRVQPGRGVVGLDDNSINLLSSKRVAVQDELRIAEIIRSPPELMHTDVRIFRRKLIRDAFDGVGEPSWLESHKAMLAFIRSYHGADWKHQHTVDTLYTNFNVSHLDAALAEWERNMDTMRVNIILYVSLFADIEHQRLAIQRIMQTHAQWVDIVAVHVTLTYHPLNDRRNQVADEVMLWWARVIQPTPSMIMDLCLAHRDWGLRLPISCLLNTLSKFDGKNGWPRWPSANATQFLVDLCKIQMFYQTHVLRLLAYAIKFLVPVGYEVATVDGLAQFIRPLFNMLNDDAIDDRFELAVFYIATCSDRISDQFMSEIYNLVPSDDQRRRLALIWTGVTFTNQLQNDRMTMQVHSIKDKVSPRMTKKDYSERALCIMCAVNERCVCFIPCGHIIACAGCSSRLPTNECPVCRATISHLQRILF